MSETIVVYRLEQAPKELTRRLPAQAGPWGCLFWVAPEQSEAVAAVLEAIPEPNVDHVREALDAAASVASFLSASDAIPAAVGAGPTYSVGFHGGDPTEVADFLRRAGHTLVPIFDLATEGIEADEGNHLDPDEALYFAAMNGDVKGCRRALKQGGRTDFEERSTGATALHEAAAGGHKQIVSLLLEAGADVDAAVKRAKTTPLGRAIEGRHLPVVKRLLAAGAKTDVRYDRMRWTPVHAAVAHRAPKILAALLEAGAEVNARTAGGQTALELAIQEGHDPKKAQRTRELIALLRQAGADPQASDERGESAIDVARSLGREHLLGSLTETL